MIVIALVPLLVAALFLVSSTVVGRLADPRVARRTAVYCATAAAVLSIALPLTTRSASFVTGRQVAGLTVVTLPDDVTRLVTVATCVAGLLIVAMSPLASHPPATLARILQLLAISAGFAAVRQGAVSVVLWALSAWLVWTGLRGRGGAREGSRQDAGGGAGGGPGVGSGVGSGGGGDGLARLFAVYHVPGVLLFGAGTALTAAGARTTGAVLVVLAIMIRFAVIPLHSWYPRFVERSPLGIVVAFGTAPVGVLTQLGLRATPLPVSLAHDVALVGGLTAVVAAVFALVQSDARRALAFLMMSQTGLIACGLGNGSPAAVSGAVLTWQVSALAVSGFAMVLAALEARRGTLSLVVPGGNFARTPRLAVAFLLCGLATAGFPLSLGFAGGHLLIHGSVAESPLVWLALIGAVGVNGMTVMRCFFALFAGSRVHSGERDLVPLETYALTIAVGALLIGGVFPVIP
ncbi:proton-conducting transporter membrane subunit [Streptosporangium sp. NPDC051022]|uniref:proton-conducting transporter transmembrane domain-containing protein n=1 Tax=Streptosporangium sp. NPDC051022 TaxID=3155752 RepID=UPI00341B26F0